MHFMVAMTSVLLLATSAVEGQSSSLLNRSEAASSAGGASNMAVDIAASGGTFGVVRAADSALPVTRAIESVSMFAVPRTPPRRFEVEDLVSIIVRQRKTYSSEAEYEKKKKWDIDGKLTDWFRLHPGHKLGTDQLSNGDPGFNFTFNDKYKAEGDNERKDIFETRIQAKIVDIKPNGNLVLEARKEEEHDEEKSVVTLTGECRSEDVTAANSVLSTQIADLVIREGNKGSVRDATRRGWIPQILDFLRPF